MAAARARVLPGFGLTMGYTLLYLSLIVLIPLAALGLKTATLTWEQFWGVITDARVLAAYRLSFGAAFLAALVNLFAGLLVPGYWCVIPSLRNVWWMRWWIYPLPYRRRSQVLP